MAPAKRPCILVGLWVIAALACLLPRAAGAMSASFSWHGIAPCVHVSPPFALKDVPPKTARLRFIMHDRDAPQFHHGGSTIIYTGPQIAEGAISYIGPCPPSGQTHHYVWTIEALDNEGHVLAKTTASGAFPGK
jgi:phosphatidylethanolamine-binding protein (PEBP) family uncharacterized protein